VTPDPKILLRDPITGPHNLKKFQIDTILLTSLKIAVARRLFLSFLPYLSSISCLYSMNRQQEALFLLNKIINEHVSNQNNSSLFTLRARINLRNNNITDSYYDLKLALSFDPRNVVAVGLMDEIHTTAENLRNTALVLSLNNRVKDALIKMNTAIKLHPDKPEYLLQRGILFKRSRDFIACIDDFLHGLEKINELRMSAPPELVGNLRRQILLTYNEFAIVCFEKAFYDEAITLLDKAIKTEKKEKGFYINRGGMGIVPPPVISHTV
jgi:tetratricopeptide (TPR) repeat protein